MKQCYALYVFLCSYNDIVAWKYFTHHPPFVERIHQSSVDILKKRTGSGALGFPLLSSSRSPWTNSHFTADIRHDGAHITPLSCYRFSLIKSNRWHMQVQGYLIRPDDWENHMCDITTIYSFHYSNVTSTILRLKLSVTRLFVIAWIPVISQQTHTEHSFFQLERLSGHLWKRWRAMWSF